MGSKIYVSALAPQQLLTGPQHEALEPSAARLAASAYFSLTVSLIVLVISFSI